MKSGKRCILSGVIAVGLIASLSIPAMAATTIFTDVPSDAWYASDVAKVHEQGLFNGKGNNQFDPDGTLTIAEAVALSARTRANYNNETIPTVEGGKWYQGALDYAKSQGIITGTEFTNFEVNATRSEMAYLFAGALPETEYKTINNVAELPDVKNSTMYSAEIFKLYNSGVLTGSDKYGTFKPNTEISRAETAVILSRVVNADGRKSFTLELQQATTETTGYAAYPEVPDFGVLGLTLIEELDSLELKYTFAEDTEAAYLYQKPANHDEQVKALATYMDMLLDNGFVLINDKDTALIYRHTVKKTLTVDLYLISEGYLIIIADSYFNRDIPGELAFYENSPSVPDFGAYMGVKLLEQEKSGNGYVYEYELGNIADYLYDDVLFDYGFYYQEEMEELNNYALFTNRDDTIRVVYGIKNNRWVVFVVEIEH